jgi:hypothetical protein
MLAGNEKSPEEIPDRCLCAIYKFLDNLAMVTAKEKSSDDESATPERASRQYLIELMGLRDHFPDVHFGRDGTKQMDVDVKSKPNPTWSHLRMALEQHQE